MPAALPSAFALPERLVAKADPALIDGDEAHFAEIVRTLEHERADLTARLDAQRRAPARDGRRRWTAIWRSTG
ncbi:hypothetical protein [Saccharomonospora sp. CUA-673]|uniref:hypothetical protein n=1 Tax=Saccharomonospora sp. CUA-673 TaxID=1904969 RepID=UPI001C9E8FC0|nr:hypothetical protein [Saccharomonospora sp. CUA-673]